MSDSSSHFTNEESEASRSRGEGTVAHWYQPASDSCRDEILTRSAACVLVLLLMDFHALVCFAHGSLCKPGCLCRRPLVSIFLLLVYRHPYS